MTTLQAVCFVAAVGVAYISGLQTGLSMAPKAECKNCGSRKRKPRSGTNVHCARCGAKWDPVFR